MTPKELGKALQALRKRAGYTIRSFSEKLGEAGSSTYYTYERGSFKKRFLPMDKVVQWKPFLVGMGEPPITEDELLSLAGVDNSLVSPSPDGISDAVDKSLYAALIEIWDGLDEPEQRIALRIVEGLVLTRGTSKVA